MLRPHRPASRFLSSSALHLAFTLCFVLLLAACDSAEPTIENEEVGPGSLVEVALIETVTRDEINNLGIPVGTIYDVELYRLQYRTTTPDGAETVASGAIAVPVNAPGARPLATYLHGTIARKDAVASVGGTDVPEALIGVIFATGGYVTAMPDYLGLGTSPGLHPYVHSASLASASVDFLRAARSFAAREDIDLNGQVFVTGYSEGGQAAMATAQLLEEQYADEFTLTAAAPLAGSHDLSGTMTDLMLARTPFNSPYYLPYILLAYNEIYDLFDDPSEIFAAPYDATIPGLYDGTRGAAEINAALPSIPLDVVKPDYATAFETEPNHPLRQALRDNDTYHWTPTAPMRLYHCLADELVPFANSTVARDAFHARGATHVELIPLTEGGHGACAAPALIFTKFWFDTFVTS